MAKYENLAAFLKQKRIEAGLSRAELGDALGNVLGQFVANWEHALCSPPSNKLNLLIKILKIDPEELVIVMLEDSKAVIEERVNFIPKKKETTAG